ncbi:GH12943 [Drosophila grimshawi]|uniref:GH12943 n=2 Tax=Drosophila grimshawi TaxID=7222 RepID=B4K1K7_DROGR|nr:GH12943 [Drosophila grimshawi]
MLKKAVEYALPTEHQWLARITYKNGDESKLPDNSCLGALVSKLSVLAPAHCFLQYSDMVEAYSVQLGVWNKSSKADDLNCDDEGYCVLAAQDIPVAEIAIHPEYDPLTLKHSLAVLTLARSAELTPNVIPICMPPQSVMNETVVNEIFVLAGLPIKGDLKHKTFVNTISRPFCKNDKIGELVTSGTAFCGIQDLNNRYYLGAPLVGLHVKFDEPQNYYLAGLLLDSREAKSPKRTVASFLDIRPYMSFINRNAKELSVNN